MVIEIDLLSPITSPHVPPTEFPEWYLKSLANDALVQVEAEDRMAGQGAKDYVDSYPPTKPNS